VFIYTLNPCREFWEDLDTGAARRARQGTRRTLTLFADERAQRAAAQRR
jgi:exonuclease V gamma subunit